MKGFKIIVIGILSLLFVLLLYLTISYIKIGVDMPKELAERKITFMGGYILAIIFGVMAIICAIIILTCIIKWRKTHEKRIHK